MNFGRAAQPVVAWRRRSERVAEAIRTGDLITDSWESASSSASGRKLLTLFSSVGSLAVASRRGAALAGLPPILFRAASKMLTDDIDDIPASSKRVPLPLQVGVRMPASAAMGHVPLQFLAPKKPWDKPKVKKFSPEIVAEELAAEAEALANAKPEEPPPLGDADFELIDAFARKAQRMDALGQIDHAKNVARAAALLRAEAGGGRTTTRATSAATARRRQPR